MSETSESISPISAATASAPSAPSTTGTTSTTSATSAEVEKELKKSKKSEAPTEYLRMENGFLVEKGILKILKHNIENSVNTLILGPTGVGKTEMIDAIAKQLKLDLTILDMGTMADPVLSLVGSHVITVEGDKSVSTFKKSRFSEIIQKPGIVLLDEINRAAIGSNNLLFPCLDFRRELPMEYSFHDTEPIKVHPQCVFIATANTGSQYTGTHKMDKALVDRFFMIEVEPLNKSGMNFVINSIFGDGNNPEATGKRSLTKNEVTTIIDTYFSINALHDDFKITFSLSMRHVKLICKLVQSDISIYDAFYAMCKGIGGKAEVESSIKGILNVKEPKEKASEKTV